MERAGPLRHLYALAAIVGGWVLFRCETLAHAGAYYAALLGFASGDALRHPATEYVDSLVLLTLIVAAVGSAPVARFLGQSRASAPGVRSASELAILSLDTIGLGVVFLASASFLAAGTYNPFIYFRF